MIRFCEVKARDGDGTESKKNLIDVSIKKKKKTNIKVYCSASSLFNHPKVSLGSELWLFRAY
jgi:hypothetical protein